MMDLSISIVSWNTKKLLDECLESVFETTHDIEFEVIVVDNTSSDGSARMVREKYPQVCVIENNENVGFAKANNQAYALSTGRHFLLLNPDTVVLGDALKKLVMFSDNNDKLGAAGPLVLNDDGSLQYSWARFPTLWTELIGKLDRCIAGQPHPPLTAEETRRLEPFRTDWVGGCCMMIKRKAIEQIGLMDESFFMYCEETDWCFRLYKAGWVVWVEPSAEIVHYGGKSSEQVSEGSRRILAESKIMLFRKHYNFISAAAIRSGLYCRKTLRYLRRYGSSS